MNFLAVAVNSNGDNIIVPAQGPNKRIVIKELFLAGLGSVSGHLKSDTGTDGSVHFASLALQFPFTLGSGFVLNGLERRWTGDTNTPMILNLSDSVGVVGHVRYDIESEVIGEG